MKSWKTNNGQISKIAVSDWQTELQKIVLIEFIIVQKQTKMNMDTAVYVVPFPHLPSF